MKNLNDIVDLCAGIVKNKTLPAQRISPSRESFDPLKIGFEFCDVDIFNDGLINERYISSNKHILYLIYNTSYKLLEIRLCLASGQISGYNTQRLSSKASHHYQISQWILSIINSYYF